MRLVIVHIDTRIEGGFDQFLYRVSFYGSTEREPYKVGINKTIKGRSFSNAQPPREKMGTLKPEGPSRRKIMSFLSNSCFTTVAGMLGVQGKEQTSSIGATMENLTYIHKLFSGPAKLDVCFTW